VLAAGALLPAPGAYDVVFDSRSRAGAGRFMFRYWVNDVTPPTARLRSRAVRSGESILVGVADAGSGVDADTLVATIDGKRREASFAGGDVRIATKGVAPGRHLLVLQVSDYQETRNTENVAGVLPNTRRLVASITLR
jgi:hypothetical protein